MKYAETPLDLSPPIVVLADCPPNTCTETNITAK